MTDFCGISLVALRENSITELNLDLKRIPQGRRRAWSDRAEQVAALCRGAHVAQVRTPASALALRHRAQRHSSFLWHAAWTATSSATNTFTASILRVAKAPTPWSASSSCARRSRVALWPRSSALPPRSAYSPVSTPVDTPILSHRSHPCPPSLQSLVQQHRRRGCLRARRHPQGDADHHPEVRRHPIVFAFAR